MRSAECSRPHCRPLPEETTGSDDGGCGDVLGQLLCANCKPTTPAKPVPADNALKTPPSGRTRTRWALAAASPVTLETQNANTQRKPTSQTNQRADATTILERNRELDCESAESKDENWDVDQKPGLWVLPPPAPKARKVKKLCTSRAYWPYWDENKVLAVPVPPSLPVRLTSGLSKPTLSCGRHSGPQHSADFLTELLQETDTDNVPCKKLGELSFGKAVPVPANATQSPPRGPASAPERACLAFSTCTSRTSSAASSGLLCDSLATEHSSLTAAPLPKAPQAQGLPTVKPFQPPARTWTSSASSASSADSDEGSTVGSGRALRTLTEMFGALAPVIPDILAACHDDPTEAFDKLQQMQDQAEDAAFGWESPPPSECEEMSPGQKVEVLLEQYRLPRGVIEETLRRNDYNLDKASCELLLCNEDEKQQVATDRALAEEVNNALASGFTHYNPALKGNSPAHNAEDTTATDLALAELLGVDALREKPAPHTRTPPEDHSASHEDALEGMSQEMWQHFTYLCACFPGAPPHFVRASLDVAMGNLDLAKQVLRDEGQEEDFDRSSAAFEGSSQTTQWGGPPSMSGSPPHKSLSPSTQDIYKECRAESHRLKREIVVLEEEVKRLKQQGRFNEASLVGLKIRSLVRESRAADQQAGTKIFSALNVNSCTHRKIDLHGQHVGEALDKMEDLVSYCLDDKFGDNWCEVVTGKGNNSRDNIPKVQRAVVAYLRQRGLLPIIPQNNTGVVCFRTTLGLQLKPSDRQNLRI